MSAQPTPVSVDHFRYIDEHTAPEDPDLEQLKKEAVKAGLPPIWISTGQARLIQILLRGIGASEVVEVGTLAGYSALVMARALPEGGLVKTIELNPAHADFATEWVERCNAASRVKIFRGAGVEVLTTFADRSADAVFLDADKGNYSNYVDASARILRPGGLLLVDNAFAFGQLFDESPTDPEVGAIRAFNDKMACDERFSSTIVPVGDGCWVAVRLG